MITVLPRITSSLIFYKCYQSELHRVSFCSISPCLNPETGIRAVGCYPVQCWGILVLNPNLRSRVWQFQHMLLNFDLEEIHPELGIYCDFLWLNFEENLTLVVFGFIILSVHLENYKERFWSLHEVKLIAFAAEIKRWTCNLMGHVVKKTKIPFIWKWSNRSQ